LELKKSAKKTQEAMALATEESTKSKAAKEVIKSLTAQVNFFGSFISLGTVCTLKDNFHVI